MRFDWVWLIADILCSLGLFTGYVAKAKAFAAANPDACVVPAIWEVSRPGHNWTQQSERYNAIVNLLQWIKHGTFITRRRWNNTVVSIPRPTAIRFQYTTASADAAAAAKFTVPLTGPAAPKAVDTKSADSKQSSDTKTTSAGAATTATNGTATGSGGSGGSGGSTVPTAMVPDASVHHPAAPPKTGPRFSPEQLTASAPPAGANVIGGFGEVTAVAASGMTFESSFTTADLDRLGIRKLGTKFTIRVRDSIELVCTLDEYPMVKSVRGTPVAFEAPTDCIVWFGINDPVNRKNVS